MDEDSITSGNGRQLPPVRAKDMTEYRSLQQEVESQRDSLVARLKRLTSGSSERLLNSIAVIGNELDSEIKNCPKVGLNQIYESACVATAEARAEEKRVGSCDRFLSTINGDWAGILEPLQKSLESRAARISRLLSTTKHPRLISRLKRLQLETLHTIGLVLNSVDEVTRLAAQFSR